MCLLNAKHQCQRKLAILSNGYFLIYILVCRRQRCLIFLLSHPSQFKVDNSANLVLFKQFNLISSFRSLFKSLSKLKLSSFVSLNLIHYLYYLYHNFIYNSNLNKIAHSDPKFSSLTNKNSFTIFNFKNKIKILIYSKLKKHFSIKFRKFKITTKNTDNFGILPEKAKLRRQLLNSTYLKNQSRQNLRKQNRMNCRLQMII